MSTFQRYVFMLYTRFVRTSGNGLSHKTWSHFLFAQHLKAYLMHEYWWTCLRYDNFFLMLDVMILVSLRFPPAIIILVPWSLHIKYKHLSLFTCNMIKCSVLLASERVCVLQSTPPVLKTRTTTIEESISEIVSHHILEEASELWSCN